MQALERKSHFANIGGFIVACLCLVVALFGLRLQYLAYRATVGKAADGESIMPHSWWIIGLLVALLIVGIGLLWRSVRAEITIQREAQPIAPPAAVLASYKDNTPYDPLPPSRPIVVPIRYGKITSGPEAGHSGISLRNDGEPAYNVFAHNVTLSGICTFEMVGTPEQLRKGDPELSFGCWRNSENGGTLGNKLYDFMVQHDIDQIAIPVTYRDADFNWYQTDVLLIKDQMARSTSGSESGMRVDWKQKKINAPIQSDVPTLAASPIKHSPDVPDVFLEWALPNPEFPGISSEKEIIVVNRSTTDYAYNIVIAPLTLATTLRFGKINELKPQGRFPIEIIVEGFKEPHHKPFVRFFMITDNYEVAEQRGLITHKPSGLAHYVFNIPLSLTYSGSAGTCTKEITMQFDSFNGAKFELLRRR